MIRMTLLSLAAALSLSLVAFAQTEDFDRAKLPFDTYFVGEAGDYVAGVRCGTPELTELERALIDAEVESHRASMGREASARPTVKVAYHVIQHKDGTGRLSKATVKEQHRVLRQSKLGINFEWHSMDRAKSNRWFTRCDETAVEKSMKRALSQNQHSAKGEMVMDVYFCKPGGGILGWAYFPSSFPKKHHMHGVVALFSSVPGGSSAPYDLGDTLVHEAGHWIGLYHTFQGGCNAPGDHVGGTPYEASPAFGCPTGRDSCPARKGLDPIYNFMDYSDDACMDHLISGQRRRALDQLATYR